MTTKDSTNSINAFNVLYLYEYPLFLSIIYIQTLFSVWMNKPLQCFSLTPSIILVKFYAMGKRTSARCTNLCAQMFDNTSLLWWIIMCSCSSAVNRRNMAITTLVLPIFSAFFYKTTTDVNKVKVWGLDGWFPKAWAIIVRTERTTRKTSCWRTCNWNCCGLTIFYFLDFLF